MHSFKRAATLIIFFIIMVAQGLVFYLTHLTINAWYLVLELPNWLPPGIHYGPTWTGLHVLIILSGFLFWMLPSSRGRTLTLLFLIIQLAVTGVWSFLFFGLHSPLLGGIFIVLMLLFLVLSMIYGFKIHKWAAYLLIPYLIWMIIMGVYIWEIIYLNH